MQCKYLCRKKGLSNQTQIPATGGVTCWDILTSSLQQKSLSWYMTADGCKCEFASWYGVLATHCNQLHSK